MTRFCLAAVVLVIAALGVAAPGPVAPLSVCELAKDLPAHRDKVITVRGIYFYGLRETCPQKCATGIWPSFLDLQGGRDSDWDALSQASAQTEAAAKKTGKRFELRATFKGVLLTRMKPSPRGPCDRASWFPGYGHLGGYPASLLVQEITNIEIRENPNSPYDYANIYHGPL